MGVADINTVEPALAGAASEGRSNRISPQARRHVEIRRQILKAHPEAAELAGTAPWTAAIALGLLAIHWSVLWLVLALAAVERASKLDVQPAATDVLTQAKLPKRNGASPAGPGN